MVGIKVGVNDGWGPVQIGTPESSECGAGKSCVRLEVDEIEDPNGELCVSLILIILVTYLHV